MCYRLRTAANIGYHSGDEDIRTMVAPTTPTATHVQILEKQGLVTKACTRQLNYQGHLFLGASFNVHQNMMLPRLDMFVLLRNERPGMYNRDELWSMIKHGNESGRAGKDKGA